jgi:hypothetical protein
MAIVPDLSGTRPGRTGNIPLSDPRNRSLKERMTRDDCYTSQTNVELVAGNQSILSEDKTRNALLFMIPENAETVYISTSPLSAAGGLPVIAGSGLELKGKATEHSYYAWSESGSVLLSIWVG